MFNRLCFGALLSACLAGALTGCNSSSNLVNGLSVTPATVSLTGAGSTAQLSATGQYGSASHHTYQDITDQVTWTSGTPSVATVSSTGLVTAVAAGTTQITASISGYGGNLTASASITVSATGTTGSSGDVTSISLIPSTLSVAAAGQTGQFVPIGNVSSGGTVSITGNVVWKSSSTSIATVDASTGVVTGVAQGTATITAIYTNADGTLAYGTGAFTVASGGSSSTSEPLLSINIVPGGVTVSSIGQTSQFLAFGTFAAAPTVRDLTDYVQWLSLAPDVASINTNSTTGGQISATSGEDPLAGSNNLYNYPGLATAEGYTGNSVIYAEATNPDGTVVLSNPETFTCKDSQSGYCDPEYAPSQFVTITVFNAGPNETTWDITAPSDTGTADLIHCGPGWTGTGGSVCTGVYAYNPTQTIVLTENSTANSFGGWNLGSNCEETSVYSTTCTVLLDHNQSVGAIFY